jgi:arylsulfatase A-like enzyme
MQLLTGNRMLEVFRRVEPWHLHKTPGTTIERQALDWLAKTDRAPFFAYLHVVDPHWPYYDQGFGFVTAELGDLSEPHTLFDLMRLPKSGPRNARLRDKPELRELVARYDEEVRFADAVLGRVLKGLRDLGLDRRTLVIVLGDHGEEFFEHNSFGHGHDVFENLVHVPLVFLWPDDPRFADMPPAVEPPVSLLDVFPTLVDYLGLPPAPTALRGRSLRGLLEGTAAATPVLSRAFTQKATIGGYREGHLKVRLRYGRSAPPQETKQVRVYDLEKDPRELRPQAYVGDSRLEELVRRAREEYQGIYSRRRATEPRGSTPELDEPEALRRLRDLGYLD